MIKVMDRAPDSNTVGSRNMFLISASYDGDILLWSLETGRVTMRFNANEGTIPFMTLEHAAVAVDSSESINRETDTPDLLYTALESGSEKVFDVVKEVTGTDCLSNHKLQTVAAHSDRDRHSARHSIYTRASSRNSDSSMRTCRKGRNKGKMRIRFCIFILFAGISGL